MKILNKIKEFTSNLTKKQKLSIVLLAIIMLFIGVKNSEFVIRYFSPVYLYDGKIGEYESKNIEVISNFYDNAIYVKFICNDFESERYKFIDKNLDDNNTIAIVHYISKKAQINEKVTILKSDIFYTENKLIGIAKIPNVTKRQFKKLDLISIEPIKALSMDMKEIEQINNYF